jgi:hypothetical protein
MDYKYALLCASHIFCIIIFAFFYKCLGRNHFNGINDENIDYFYLSATIQSTVGFGDITPKTYNAKRLVMIHQFMTLVLVCIIFMDIFPVSSHKKFYKIEF